MTSRPRSLSPWAALIALVLTSTTFGAASPAAGIIDPTSDTTGGVEASVTCSGGLSNTFVTFEWQRGTVSSETTTIGLRVDGDPLLNASAPPGSSDSWGIEGFEGPESGSATYAIYTWFGGISSLAEARLVAEKTVTWDCSSTFSDVPATRAFAREITWLADSGITSGFSDGTFRPLGTVNRDAMAAFLYRFAGVKDFDASPSASFSDVSSSTPFFREITWLATTEITGGYSDGTFRPGSPVNRDAMAAFLYRFAGKPAFTPPATSPFDDITPSTPFYKEITWLASTGVTGGFSDGTFRPLEPVNRDAMAAFLYRFSEQGLCGVCG